MFIFLEYTYIMIRLQQASELHKHQRRDFRLKLATIQEWFSNISGI